MQFPPAGARAKNDLMKVLGAIGGTSIPITQQAM